MSKTSTHTTAPGKRRRVRRLGSVQQHFVRIRHIYDHMLCLSTGSKTSYDFINVLVVEGISYDLKSAEEQTLLNEQFQSLLAGMGQDVQIMWRVSPLDLGDYLQQFEVTPEAESAPSEEIWRLLSSSHADFLQALGQRRTLLKREIYVVLRTNSLGKAMSQAQRLLRTRAQQRVRWSQQIAQARQDLDLQAGEMMRLLADMNLSVRRLRGVDALTSFYYRYLWPTHAQQFPLHGSVIEAIDRPIVKAGAAERAGSEELSQGQQALVALEPAGKHAVNEEIPLSFTQLADLVAPAAMTVGPDYLTIEKEFARVLVVQNMPRSVFPGWLKPLADLDEPMEISFHFHPHSSDAVMPQLRRQYRAYQSSLLLASQKGNDADPDTQIAGNDVGGLLLRLASGAERLLTVSVVILLRASSKHLLNERTARLQAVLHSMLLVAREALFEQDKAFRTSLPHGRCEMPGLLLDSRSASTLFPFLSNSLFHEQGILEGITPQGDPVIFDAWGDGMANANRIILGPPGWGKSHSIKSMLLRLALKYHCQQMRSPDQGLPFQAILIDHEREYTTISTPLGGQTIRLSPGSTQHLNPFDLPHLPQREAHPTEHEDRLADHVAKLHTLLEIMLADRTPDGGGALDSSEHGLLDRALYEAYRKVGISQDPLTHTRPAPLMRDLYEVLEKGDCGPDPTGLKQRLRRYVKGSLAGLFDGPTNVSLDQMIVTFDLYDLSTELRPIGLFLVSHFVWTQSFQSLIPRQLIVDEAATLMDYKSGAIFLEDLVRRARKYYLGVTVISQHPRIFQDSAIPANCATHVLMRQDATSLDLIGDMFKLSTREVQLLRRLPVGEALLLTNEKRLHVRFEASEVEHLLATTDRREITSWSQQTGTTYDLLRALHLLDGPPQPVLGTAREAFPCPQLPFPDMPGDSLVVAAGQRHVERED